MNPLSSEFITETIRDLRENLACCDAILTMVSRENQALTNAADYPAFEFYQGRKNLLPRLDSCLNDLRKRRQIWQQFSPAERDRYPEVKMLLQALQDSMMRILQFDRENQQALLRRGLLPARHLPSAAGQQPGFVANLYRRNSSS